GTDSVVVVVVVRVAAVATGVHPFSSPGVPGRRPGAAKIARGHRWTNVRRLLATTKPCLRVRLAHELHAVEQRNADKGHAEYESPVTRALAVRVHPLVCVDGTARANGENHDEDQPPPGRRR